MAKSWFDVSFKEAVKQCVRGVEAKSAAELVVAVRPASGNYRHVHLAVGAFAALGVLCVFLYHPAPFDFTFLPLELAAVFLIAGVISMSVTPMARALTSKRLMRDSVELAASAAFTDLGVHKTRDRTGILVFVSTFERRVVARPDIGVPVRELGDAWSEWCKKLDALFRKGRREEFLAALGELGSLLEEKLPRRADDQNELADDVSETPA